MGIQLNYMPAASVSLETLADAFNAAFAGYFYPSQLDGAKLSRRVRLEQIDLQHSLLAYDDAQLVGLALLGIRGSQGWCGGFGIVPEYRGRGCAKELLSAHFAEARGCGLKKLSLEVLTQNTPAIRLYKRAGMSITRDLLILERTLASGVAENAQELKAAEPPRLLRHFERLHTWLPAWQRSFISLLSAEEVRGVYLGDAGMPDAYALLVARPDGIMQVLDLAAMDATAAHALAAGLAHRCGALRVVNEPEESLFIAALSANGFAEMDRQHEMSCEL